MIEGILFILKNPLRYGQGDLSRIFQTTTWLE